MHAAHAVLPFWPTDTSLHKTAGISIKPIASECGLACAKVERG